jgi:hypothetical protein
VCSFEYYIDAEHIREVHFEPVEGEQLWMHSRVVAGAGALRKERGTEAEFWKCCLAGGGIKTRFVDK